MEAHDTLDASRILPPHEVRDAQHLAALVASMNVDGWTGRPILVRDCNGFHGWTGSHRIAAAQIVGIKVPVVYMTADLCWDDYRDDEDRLEAIEEAGDEDAAEVMRAEMDANRDR